MFRRFVLYSYISLLSVLVFCWCYIGRNVIVSCTNSIFLQNPHTINCVFLTSGTKCCPKTSLLFDLRGREAWAYSICQSQNYLICGQNNCVNITENRVGVLEHTFTTMRVCLLMFQNFISEHTLGTHLWTK